LLQLAFPWANPLGQPTHHTSQPATNAEETRIEETLASHKLSNSDSKEEHSEGHGELSRGRRGGSIPPEVKDPQRWQPLPLVVNYLNKHLKKSWSETDRKAILEDYPIPDVRQ